ncbi:hypothetical protein ACTXT7_016233 [Hymenolepis weldensis]
MKRLGWECFKGWEMGPTWEMGFELTESFNGTPAYFKRREEVEMKLLSFVESKLANFHEEGMRKLMARGEDVINKNGDYVEH